MLPGFDVNGKIRLLHELRDKAEIIFCISAGDIEKTKMRADLGISYDMEVLRLIDDITAMDMDASAVVTAMLSGGVDACAIWSPQSLTILDEMENATKLAQNTDFSDISISLASWIVMPEYLEENHDVAVRFMRALLKAMDYAALEENYEEVSGWVADFLALDVEDVLMQARGDADWLTGKEVLAGIEDGTVDGYYELQQEMMVTSGAITEEEKCPVSDYVNYDTIPEAGNYSVEAVYRTDFCLAGGGGGTPPPLTSWTLSHRDNSIRYF